MNDFLAFLNSADAETLTKTPGISPTLADSLIAARPFETAEDCLKVHGMGKALLARLQSAFEAGGNASEERALQPVEEEAVMTIPPAGESDSSRGPSFGSRVGALGLSLFRGLVRLLALFIIVGAIAAVLWVGGGGDAGHVAQLAAGVALERAHPLRARRLPTHRRAALGLARAAVLRILRGVHLAAVHRVVVAVQAAQLAGIGALGRDAGRARAGLAAAAAVARALRGVHARAVAARLVGAAARAGVCVASGVVARATRPVADVVDRHEAAGQPPGHRDREQVAPGFPSHESRSYHELRRRLNRTS